MRKLPASLIMSSLIMSSLIIMAWLTGCGMFADVQRPAAPAPVRVTNAISQQQPATAGQIAAVEVSWEDQSILRKPDIEARLLADTVMQELRKRGLAHDQAGNILRVRVMEVFLRSSGLMKTGTDVLNTRVYLLSADGAEQFNFIQRSANTNTAHSTSSLEQKIAILYQRFAEQAVDELQARLPQTR